MQPNAFQTSTVTPVTAVTASEMVAVDRVAVDEFGISLLQMMENAGRNLAWHVRDTRTRSVTVLAGNGGTGTSRERLPLAGYRQCDDEDPGVAIAANTVQGRASRLFPIAQSFQSLLNASLRVEVRDVDIF